MRYRRFMTDSETDSPKRSPHELFKEGYASILEGLALLGYKVDADENFRDTADRAARAIAEMVLPVAEAEKEAKDLLSHSFPAKYEEMVISKHNTVFGICPHHLLPVMYRISMAYIPHRKVIGLSKLSRLADLLARQPILQEDLTHELARILHVDLESLGAAAYVEGFHLCMAARGSRTHEARIVTSAVRGVFLAKPATRQEFLDLVTASSPGLP
ncbi:MAG: GTP cyclohydrolase I [Pseudomonadota bacterium]